MRWVDLRLEELETKPRSQWDQDDYEAYCYCQECIAEDERDAEYLDCMEVIY